MEKQINRLELTASQVLRNKILEALGNGVLFSIAALAAIAVLFIIYFIAKDALPFFQSKHLLEFFTSSSWYPTAEPVKFGALAIFAGSALVTIGSALVAIPLGVSAAVCLSDVLPFSLRQYVKPVIEILAAIPSVAYGFFALVVFAPLLQNSGGTFMATAWLVIATPVIAILSIVFADLLTTNIKDAKLRKISRTATTICLFIISALLLIFIAATLKSIQIMSGTNALNVSIILGIMALPTIVSVAEDSLQAVGREIREGSYALGATRAETLVKTILPAAKSGILAAILLGVMRALGETMVVWMASGNAAQIPTPFYNFLEPVRTLTATIAGEMGEADQSTGSMQYHVLFAMGLCLLIFCFICNLISEWVVRKERKKLGA
ncbi:MAG: PstC family ABC transporter permease [Kiritimatiellae bacterium]|jgi:phosphate transport system permease protein|nr:PstC family ABC transporter permease [Kiritimatiellia bacterium]